MSDTSHTLRVAHVLRTTSVTHGTGVTRVVQQLAPAQREAGLIVTVHSPTPRAVSGRVASVRELGRQTRVLTREIIAAQPDVIHSHGIWHPGSYAAHAAARRLGVPHICSLHGMLDPWVLRHTSALKKRIAATLVQDRVLRACYSLHAVAEEEVEAFRLYGLHSPAAVIYNGVDERFLRVPRSKERFVERFPQFAGKRIVLFLSRVHPKKGLIPLVEGWAALGAEREGWHLVIAGGDEVNHAAEVTALADALDVGDSVSLIGQQPPEEVEHLYGAADVFALTSFSEAFSMSMLEAVACGAPVLLSRACNMHVVVEAGGGLECEPTATSVREGLATLLALDDAEREAMGQRCRCLVANTFTWPSIAQDFFTYYRWAAGQIAAPAFIRTWNRSKT